MAVSPRLVSLHGPWGIVCRRVERECRLEVHWNWRGLTDDRLVIGIRDGKRAIAMKVTILLADAAQAVGGKLYILGGGWSVTGPDPTPSALAMKIEVPWTEANRRHELTVALLDADGNPVIIGDNPVEIRGEFEVGRPPGLPAGTPLDATIAIPLNPFPLAPGGRYVWRVTINGESRENWNVGFITRRTAPPGRIAIP